MINALCLQCATLLPSGTEELIFCPACGFSIQRSTFQQLFDYASDAIEIGFHYRRKCEVEGITNKRSSLPPLSEIWVFVALAALIGIIGNATYDLVKKTIRKIIPTQGKAREETKRTTGSFLDLEDDSFLNLFIEYMSDFHNGFNNLPPDLRDYLDEELLVHQMVRLSDDEVFEDYLSKGLKEKSEEEKKAFLVTPIKALRVVEKRRIPSTEDFIGFWKKL